jgi:glycosyltransferase involved in cell wall biosynthesis
MNFFINKAMGHGNSGVEHAQFYRAARFREKKLPFKLIFTDLLPKLHDHMQEWHLAENEVIGLYDYFLSDDPDAYLKNGNPKVNEFSENVLWDQTNTQRLMTRVTTGLYTEKVQRVKRYSDEKKLYLVEDDRVILENGQHRMMWHYRDHGKLDRVPSSIRLSNFKGHDYYFGTFEKLLAFFFQEIATVFPKSVYFMDRGSENEEALILMKRQGYELKLIDIVHAAHLSSFQGGHPLWNNFYQYMFDHVEDMDAVVSATRLQTAAMKSDLQKNGILQTNQLVTIPVGGVEEVSPAKTWEGNELKFVTASRLHPEKHIAHIVKSIKILRDRGLNATLTIYGSGSDEGPLKQLIEKLQLTSSVTLGGLSLHVVNDLKQYDAFVSASYSEGFGLTYMEAIGDALPIATYANLFGAQELVIENKNGHLALFDRTDEAEASNIANLAEAMSRIFTSPEHYAQLSQGAKQVATEFQAPIIAERWSQLVRSLLDEN